MGFLKLGFFRGGGGLKPILLIVLGFSAFLIFFAQSTFFSFAAPPGSPYNPGETLNPSCAPGDANCTVNAPTTGFSTSTFVTFYLSSSTLGGDSSFTFNSSTKLLSINTSTILGLTFTNATGTNLTVTTILDSQGNKYSTSTGGGGGGVTTSSPSSTPNSFTYFTTETGAVSGSSTIFFTTSSLLLEVRGLASTSQFVAPSATITSAQFTNATTTNLRFTNATGTNLFTTTASSTNFGWTFATGTRLTVVNVSSTNLNLSSLTGTRLLQSNSASDLISVADLTAWIAGTTSELTVTDDGDGTITLSLPSIVDLGATSEFRAVSSTITDAQFTTVTSTNIRFTNATGTNLFTTTASSTNFGWTFATGTQLTVVSVSSTNISNTGYLTVQGISTLATTTVSSSLSIGTSTSAASTALFTIATSTNIMTVLQDGTVGIGTSSPATLFTVAGATNLFNVLSSGLVGIATSTPQGRLHVIGLATSTGTGTVTSTATFGDLSITGTSTALFGTEIRVGDVISTPDQWRIVTAIGSATSAIVDSAFFPPLTNATSFYFQPPSLRIQDNLGSDSFLVTANGTVIADQTSFGSLVFPEDSGVVSWTDMSVSSTLATAPVGYTASIDGIPLLTLLADSDGTGGIRNSRVVIGQPATSTQISSSSMFIANFFTVASDTPKSTSGSLVFFGDGYNLNGGSASGTILGINMATTTFGDFLNFQINSSTAFKMTSSSLLIATTTQIAQSLFYVATTSSIMVVLSDGTVGVGTSTPTQRLTVDGHVLIQGGLCLRSDTGCPAFANGRLYVDTAGTVADDPGDTFDIAERYTSREVVESGDLVGIDSATSTVAAVRRALPGDTLIGIVSTKPAITINGSHVVIGPGREPTSTTPMVALSGRVPLKVSLEGGAIHKGDYLTISSVPGVAKKASESGNVVGIALANYESQTPSSTVLTFMQLGYQKIGESTAASSVFAGGSSGLFASVFSAVKDWFVSVKEWAVEKLTATTIIAGRVETDVLKTNNIEMTDRRTGVLYCVTLENGEFVKTPGPCAATLPPSSSAPSASKTTPENTPPENVPPPENASSTPPVVAEPPVVDDSPLDGDAPIPPNDPVAEGSPTDSLSAENTSPDSSSGTSAP